MQHLADLRAIRMGGEGRLDAAAEKAQWDSTPPAGSYRGIARGARGSGILPDRRRIIQMRH